MQEIWKLIELLQIYDNRNDSIGDTIQYRIENWNVQRSVKWIDRWVNVWWYSKSFWFIKWLVENDKVDIDKLKFQSDFMFPLWKDFDQLGSEDIEEYSEYESLLMLLSISDTPIEDLLLYLK